MSKYQNILRRLRREAFAAQDGLCWWCENPMLLVPVMPAKYPQNLCTAEHLIPREFGGSTSAGNIVAACRKCNNSKRNYEVLRLNTPLAQWPRAAVS